ncbi:MAG: DUF4215 domain-containing protein [archaeon]
MKKELVVLVFGFFGVFLFSGFVSAGNLINADSCSQVDVQAAIDAASAGDTVKVPAGSCVWSATVTIPDTKKITLRGQGYDNTVITADVNAIWMGTSGSRVTGFGFILPSANVNIIEVKGEDWRIDNCKFNNLADASRISISANGVNVAVAPKGVIDNCVFLNGRIGVGGLGTFAKMSGIWANDLNLGTDDAVYVEDCVFTRPDGIKGKNCIDAGYGGKYVFRYNSVTDTQAQAHSLQAANTRGTRKWEIYNNEFISLAGDWAPIFIRGGTGVIFNNTLIGAWNSKTITVDNVRSSSGDVDDDLTGDGRCDGNNVIDGNTLNEEGWPCRDQIGRSTDQWLWTTENPYPPQELDPAYFWNNKNEYGNSIEVYVHNGLEVENHIQENRDYYNNVKKLGYTPYTYPHPLTQPFCGDHIIEGTEECDDGNNIDGDGCSSSCLDEDVSCQLGDQYKIINSTNIQACTCEQADVQAAVDAASAGDTVNVPAGSCVWSSGITIPGGVKLIGAGAFNPNDAYNTVISSTPFIEFYLENGAWVEGIRFENGGAFPVPTTGRIDWVIKDNYFGNSDTPHIDNKEVIYINDLYAVNATSGVYHGNYFYGVTVDLSGRGRGTIDWYSDTDAGGTDNKIYFESNTYDLTGWDGALEGYSQISDAGRGGGYVFRFNKFIWGYLENHGSVWDGAGDGDNKRATRFGEIYLNYWINADSYSFSWNWKWRGGVLFAFGNDAEGHTSRCQYRLVPQQNAWNISDEWNTIPHPYPGSDSGSFGYRDFMGMGKDVALSDSPYTVIDQEDQTYEPCYLWDNKCEGSQRSVIVQSPYDPYVIENRDFFSGDGTSDAGVHSGPLAFAPECSSSTAYYGYWATDQGNWNTHNTDVTDDGSISGYGAYGKGNGVLYQCDPDTLTWEVYYTPATYPHPLLGGSGATCGNGIIENGEECDEGNINNGDGCSSSCKIESLCIHASDTNCDGKVDIKELIFFITKYNNGEITISELTSAIDVWKGF